MPLHRVSLDLLTPGSLLVAEEAEYFGAKTKVAAVIERVEVDAEEKYLVVRPTGTDSEGILRVFTGNPSTPFRAHLCRVNCDKMETGDRVLHIHRGRQGKLAEEEAWVRSLEGVGRAARPGPEEDQLQGLRERAEAMGSRPAPSGMAEPVLAGSDVKRRRGRRKRRKKIA